MAWTSIRTGARKSSRASTRWGGKAANAMTVAKAVGAYLEAFETTPSKRSGQRPKASTLRQEGVWLHRLIAMHGLTAIEELTVSSVQSVLEAHATIEPPQRVRCHGSPYRLGADDVQGAIEASPLERIDPPAPPASRDRTPSPSEVKAILEAADNCLASGRWRTT